MSQKFWEPSLSSGPCKDEMKFDAEDPHVIGATIQNLVTW
jgi:hypothetical protein